MVGCEWCQAESEDTYKDGIQIHVHKDLARPFCASQATCFGGVMGAPTPYGDRPQSKDLLYKQNLSSLLFSKTVC